MIFFGRRRRKEARKKYEALMEESRRAGEAVAGIEPCESPRVLTAVNIESLVKEFESPVIPAMIVRAYDSMSKYWCYGELGRLILDDFEKADKAGALEKLLPPYLVALYDICEEYKQYQDEPLCKSLKQIHGDLKNVLGYVVSTMGGYNPLRAARLEKGVKMLVEKDRKRLHRMYDEYEEIMKKAK